MKFMFRRLLLGVVIVPLVALAYFVLYALLVGVSIGGLPTTTPSEVWANGLMFGVVATLVFAGSAVAK